MDLMDALGYDPDSPEVRQARRQAEAEELFDDGLCGTPPVKIETTQLPDGSYRSRVTVDGEFYAEVCNPNREDCVAEAVHYGNQAVDDYWSPWRLPDAAERAEVREILKGRLEEQN